MAAASDPFESHLKRAGDLFEAGDIVQAGQIWQAILKKRPDHEAARAGLYKVKLYFDARATQGGLAGQKSAEGVRDGRTTQDAPPKAEDPDIKRLLEQGCTLYDAGHVEDALTRWVQVLAKEPDNVLAKGYINGARRTLGQPDEAPAPQSAPAPGIVPGPTVDTERLLRDGCTLFDMGQLEDALKKWEQILAHDPAHSLAQAYVQDARKDLGLPAGARPVAAAGEPVPVVPAPMVGAEDERLEHLMRDGVQLYDMGMLQEATQKWQQVLDLVPGHKDAEAYLAMVKRDVEAPAARPTAGRTAAVPQSSELSGGDFPGLQSRTAQVSLAPMAPLELDREEATVAEQPVAPPPALTSGVQKARKGLNLPDALQRISLPSWMASPVFILGTIAGLVILVFGSFYFLKHRKDRALEQSVAAFRATAVSPVARNSEIATLQQSPDDIQQEARSALGEDPLLAYLRAKENLRLNPGDAASGQLMDRAKADLAKAAASSASIGDFEKQFRSGDLESADRIMTALLSQNPEDRILRERASRLYGAMIQAYASKERWTEAETRLRLGRAMFPEEGSWSVKLRLLAQIQSLPRSERGPWIQLLG